MKVWILRGPGLGCSGAAAEWALDAAIAPERGEGPELAVVSRLAVLGPLPASNLPPLGGAAVIFKPGSADQTPANPADADDPAASSVATWGPTGRATFESALANLLDHAGGARVLIHPTSEDVISDIPSVLAMLRTHAGRPLGVFLEPTALLAPTMLASAEDHLDRIAQALIPHPGVGAVLLTNAQSAPVHRGPIALPLLKKVMACAAAANKPVVLHDDELKLQKHALGI